MATRGVRPKNGFLRLVDGTHRTTRHGDKDLQKENVEKAFSVFGKIAMPDHVTGGAAAVWERFIVPAAWLDGSREAAAVAFCELYAEFLSNPLKFPNARHGQLRAYMSELGLTDERNRWEGAKPEEKDEFFGD